MFNKSGSLTLEFFHVTIQWNERFLSHRPHSAEPSRYVLDHDKSHRLGLVRIGGRVRGQVTNEDLEWRADQNKSSCYDAQHVW